MSASVHVLADVELLPVLEDRYVDDPRGDTGARGLDEASALPQILTIEIRDRHVSVEDSVELTSGLVRLLLQGPRVLGSVRQAPRLGIAIT